MINLVARFDEDSGISDYVYITTDKELALTKLKMLAGDVGLFTISNGRYTITTLSDCSWWIVTYNPERVVGLTLPIHSQVCSLMEKIKHEINNSR
jgi:hypothetical protein